MLNIERFIAFLAAILSIVNVLWAFSNQEKFFIIEVPEIKLSSLLIKIFLFLTLEFALSLFFAKIFYEILTAIKSDLLSIIIIWIAGFSSVYTSIFNIQWFFMSGVIGWKFHIGFLFWSLIANSILSMLCQLVEEETIRKKNELSGGNNIRSDDEVFLFIFIIHGIAFLLMYAVLIFDGFFSY